MQIIKKNLSALLIGAGALAMAAPAHAQLGVSVGDANVSANVGGTAVGGGGDHAVSADVDANVGGTNATADVGVLGENGNTNADVNLGTDGGATASVSVGVGDGVDADVNVGTGGGSNGGGSGPGDDLDDLINQAGGAGGAASVVASMSDDDLQRYKKPCVDVASNSQYPEELRELCRMIMQR